MRLRHNGLRSRSLNGNGLRKKKTATAAGPFVVGEQPRPLSFLGRLLRRLVGRCGAGGERPIGEAVYVLIATSVRFFAFNFFMTLRTWTFTVLSHILSS